MDRVGVLVAGIEVIFLGLQVDLVLDFGVGTWGGSGVRSRGGSSYGSSRGFSRGW